LRLINHLEENQVPKTTNHKQENVDSISKLYVAKTAEISQWSNIRNNKLIHGKSFKLDVRHFKRGIIDLSKL